MIKLSLSETIYTNLSHSNNSKPNISRNCGKRFVVFWLDAKFNCGYVEEVYNTWITIYTNPVKFLL